MWTEGVQGFDTLPYEDIKWYYISHILSGVSMLNTKLSSYDIHIYGWLVYIFYTHDFSGWWFQPYPSEKWWTSSVGMMIIPNWMESHKIHVPNHQSASHF